jgi:hypothetical protein
MSLDEQIYNRITKFFKKEFGDMGFKLYDGDHFYNEYGSPNVKMSTLKDSDGINITVFNEFDSYIDANIYVDSLEEFDVFLESIPELAETVSVGITIVGKGTEYVQYNFKPKDSKVLQHIVDTAKANFDG